MVAPVPYGLRRSSMPVQTAGRGLAYRPLNPWQSALGGGLRGTGQLLMALGTGRPEMAGQAFSSGLDQFNAGQQMNADRARQDEIFGLELEDRQTELADRREKRAAEEKAAADFSAAVDRLPIPEEEKAAIKAGVMKYEKPDIDTDAPTVKDFYEGDKVVQKQWNQQTKTWDSVGQGQRWKPEGAGIQVDTNGDGVPDITIGGSGMPKLTEAQSTGSLQFSLADQANKTLGEADVELTSAPDYIASQFGTVGNYFKSEKYQNAEQAATVLAEQYLRALTGAAAPEPEVKRTAASIMPRPGDGPEVIAQKRATRQQIIEALRIKAGPGAVITPVIPPVVPTTGGEQSSTPSVGDIDGGYRFKGGNPGDPASWEKVN